MISTQTNSLRPSSLRYTSPPSRKLEAANDSLPLDTVTLSAVEPESKSSTLRKVGLVVGLGAAASAGFLGGIHSAGMSTSEPVLELEIEANSPFSELTENYQRDYQKLQRESRRQGEDLTRRWERDMEDLKDDLYGREPGLGRKLKREFEDMVRDVKREGEDSGQEIRRGWKDFWR